MQVANILSSALSSCHECRYVFQATGDPYYLEVGKQVLQNLNQHARVPCGFAAIRDVTSGVHEDQ